MRKETLIYFLKRPSEIWKRAFIKGVAHDRFHWIPDRIYLKLLYKAHTGKKLNLINPKSFNEKLQWLKLYDRNPEYEKIVDKYSVRNYISQQIGEEYLIPLLGVWDSFDDIDFSSLPNRFVLKCTHDSGSVVLCNDKNTFNVESARKKITEKLSVNPFWHGREWPYKGVKPRIIAEQYMEQENGDELIDYKLFCFHGEPKFIYVSQGLSDHNTARLNYMWLNWEVAPFYRNDFSRFDKIPQKPENLDKMIEFSRELSKEYMFSRVDWYEINGKVYFGEITFYPASGFVAHEPEYWETEIGKWITLPIDDK